MGNLFSGSKEADVWRDLLHATFLSSIFPGPRNKATDFGDPRDFGVGQGGA